MEPQVINILGIFFMFIGFMMLVGLGWMLFFWDLITHGSGSDYSSFIGRVRTKKARILSIFLIILGFILTTTQPKTG